MSKIVRKCIVCKRNFSVYSSSHQKLCSQECKYKFQKGKVHPGKGEKISKSLTGIPLTEERKKKIGIANLKKISSEEYKRLQDIWKHQYITDGLIAIKRANISISLRVYNRLIKENSEFFIQYPRLKFLPAIVQWWPYEKMEQFLRDAIKIHSVELSTKYGIGKKTVIRILKFHNYDWLPAGWSARNTEPERIMAGIFQELGIDFQREVKIGSYFCDFLINRYVIEVHGDYWHCNPKFYLKPVYRVQKRNIINDAFKRNFLEQQGYKVITVWEDDLKNNRKDIICQMKSLLQ